jgi:hypothetical protein
VRRIWFWFCNDILTFTETAADFMNSYTETKYRILVVIPLEKRPLGEEIKISKGIALRWI